MTPLFLKTLILSELLELLRLTQTLKLCIIRCSIDDRLFDRKAVKKKLIMTSQKSALDPFLPFQYAVILETFS